MDTPQITDPLFSWPNRDPSWNLTKTEEGYQLEKSTRVSSIVLRIAPWHDAVLQAIITEYAGLSLQMGEYTLVPQGKLQQLRSVGLRLFWVEFAPATGPIQVEGSHLRILGGWVRNPWGGAGLWVQVVLAAAQVERLDGLVQEVTGSLKKITFAQPPPRATPPRFNLANMRLWSGDSYQSGYAHGGGGYSTEEELRLSGNGQFAWKKSFVLSVPGGMMLGGGYREQHGQGTWSLTDTTLVLEFSDGNRQHRHVEVIGQKVLLDGCPFYAARL